MNAPFLKHDRRTSEVWQRLALVTDPELDESVTDLGFVEHVTVDDDGDVDIVFRLPTYWCSANFAFLMADDMRRAVSSLSWVREARPQLRDHMVAEQINLGVREGRSFADALKEFAPGGSLDELRDKFRRKAFERRQEVMILALRGLGYEDPEICRMSLRSFDEVEFASPDVARQKPRYRELLIEAGLACLPEDRTFVTYEGAPIKRHELASYLQRLRGVRINMEFNSSLCRGLLAVRDRGLSDGNPGRTPSPCGGCGSRCAASSGSP
ncbi:metal-sulfur cluster biosynthetic enzyme [Bradyrhizobium sp. USDA 4524]|uniref:iron-sulfur cluster assembly protein n=1 Tax=unclassified Bradyrhizobium TaxID=2631580 RepID=UPI00209DB071|nr:MULTISPECIES: iron-sulfur cluster assembly protein [unclassified Bradyrhizobium]MCP1845462.1 metal-sulfur cluster biosynthetic enzyme [Bradyrhizobium sp. USDA 4538]MCP1906026.1 metal-sulfur cluster biosynthetic enzyme [Bradyrhizobium sp. USDA 4537]MCP1988319.1 metal-sulfur cluster biosynthetic enzyme [Bradyrhizobium sp. USDA 4539]